MNAVKAPWHDFIFELGYTSLKIAVLLHKKQMLNTFCTALYLDLLFPLQATKNDGRRIDSVCYHRPLHRELSQTFDRRGNLESQRNCIGQQETFACNTDIFSPIPIISFHKKKSQKVPSQKLFLEISCYSKYSA